MNTEVSLLRADVNDAEKLHAMQIKSFWKMLEKYQDYDISPANESVEKVEMRLKQEFTYYYFICVGTKKVGAIRVVDKKEIGLCEEIHGKYGWELDTVLQEPGNCHLYEKMGYQKTGITKAVNERLTLVFYEKK